MAKLPEFKGAAETVVSLGVVALAVVGYLSATRDSSTDATVDPADQPTPTEFVVEDPELQEELGVAPENQQGGSRSERPDEPDFEKPVEEQSVEPTVAPTEVVVPGRIETSIQDGDIGIIDAIRRVVGEVNVWNIVLDPSTEVTLTCNRDGQAVTETFSSYDELVSEGGEVYVGDLIVVVFDSSVTD